MVRASHVNTKNKNKYVVSESISTKSTTGCPNKKYSGLIDHNVLTNEAIITRITSLDRGKTNLDFDILQLYIAKKFTKILTFRLGYIFSDVSKISENRHIKY